MYKKKNNRTSEPKLAPGMDEQKELEQSASKEEIKNGDYTSVTTLSYDEVNPS